MFRQSRASHVPPSSGSSHEHEDVSQMFYQHSHHHTSESVYAFSVRPTTPPPHPNPHSIPNRHSPHHPHPLPAHENGVCHANNETAQLPPTRSILPLSESGAAPVTHAKAASGRPSVGTSRFASLRASHRRPCSLRPACPSARPKGSSSGLRMAQCRRVSVSRCLYSSKILQVSDCVSE